MRHIAHGVGSQLRCGTRPARSTPRPGGPVTGLALDHDFAGSDADHLAIRRRARQGACG